MVFPSVEGVTTPVIALIVATLVVPDDQDPPSRFEVKVAVFPEHMDVFPLITPADAVAVMVSVRVAVLAGHPFTPACV